MFSKCIVLRRGLLHHIHRNRMDPVNVKTEETVIEMARTLRFSNRNVQFPDSIWAELVNLHFKSNTQNNYRRKQEQAI